MNNQAEVKRNWPTVMACGIGVGAGTTGIPFYTLGMFVAPLGQQFGWSSTEVQAMFSVFALGALCMFPVIGWLSDLFGSRNIALGALLGTAIGYVLLAILTNSLWTYYTAAACLGILGAGTSPITWTKVIGNWFDKQRGLALGLALAGTGVAGLLAPKYVTQLISLFDWRAAYLGLAVIALVAFVVVYFYLPKSTPAQSLNTKKREPHTESSHVSTAIPGADLQTATRDFRFWIIVIAFFIISLAIGGTIPNLFPLLTGNGMAGDQVASILGLLGLSVIFGRLVAGFLLDKLWAPGVAMFLLILPAAAVLLLSQATVSLYQAIIATLLLGLAAGAEFDLIAYMVSRYFGMAHYGKIYSVIYAAFFLGAGVAPPLFAYAYDTQGSYSGIMLGAAGLFVFGALSLLFLGRYPVEYVPVEN